MKKLLAVLILLVGVTSVQAHGYYRNGYWVGPAIIGGVVGYSLARPYYPPSVVYVQPSPTTVYVQQPSPTYIPPAGLHWETILDGSCNCYRTVLVPNQ